MAFSSDGHKLAVAHEKSPYMTIYNISDLSKVPDPAVLPSGPVFGVAFNRGGSRMAVARDTSPCPDIKIYDTYDWIREE